MSSIRSEVFGGFKNKRVLLLDMEENFVVVSLEDEKSKDVAKILSNDTARRMLEELSKGRKSISELSEELEVPISTVQYNIDALKKAGFIKDTGYRYSEKGKKMLYYEPARKIVILAPKKEEKNILAKLKMFLVPLIFGIASIGTGITSILLGRSGFAIRESMAAAPVAAGESVPLCMNTIASSTQIGLTLFSIAVVFALLAVISLVIVIWRWKFEKQ